MIHVGVDLHQAFCYMTALDSTGRTLKAGPVANEGRALRRWLRGFPEPVTVAVEACGFWPAFKDAVEEEVDEIQLVHCGGEVEKRPGGFFDPGALVALRSVAPGMDGGPPDAGAAAAGAFAYFAGAASCVTQKPGACHPASARTAHGGERRVWKKGKKLAASSRAARRGAQGGGYLLRVDRSDERSHPEAGAGDCKAGERGSSGEMAGQHSGDWRVFGDDPFVGDWRGAEVFHSQGTVQLCGIGALGAAIGGSPEPRADYAVRLSPAALGDGGSGAHSGATFSGGEKYFERLRKRKHPHVACVALARKLLGAAYALLRDGVCFDESIFATV